MDNRTFKARLTARAPLFGTFVKTPHPIVVEILGHAGFDFAVLDAEHGPFDRSAIDTLMIAGRAAGLPLVVRIPVTSPDWLLFCLDAGAAGVMVPHVNSAAQAREIAAAMRYGGDGTRGFAGTTRAAGYAARGLAEHMDATPGETVLLAQIEDPPGAEQFEEIAAVDGVDGLFVGRADLAVGLGYRDFFSPEVTAASSRVLGAADAATGLYCAPGEDLAAHRAAGASVFVIGSDHTAIVAGAGLARSAFDAAFGAAADAG